MNKQRNYDALLIRAFREDITLAQFFYWLKPYGIRIPDPELVRQPPPAKMRVQVFMSTFLRPVADRLWDTDRSEDIKTLDWMAQFKCEGWGNRLHKNDRQNLTREDKQSNERDQFIKKKVFDEKVGNQWGVTKAAIKLTRLR